VVLVTAALSYGYYVKLNGNIHRIPVIGAVVPGVTPSVAPSKAADGAENILIVGSVSRAGATAAELHEAGTTDDGGGTNTDTIIILHLAPNGGPATMISIPRDSYVPIPGHGTFKINSAYADGEAIQKGDGPALLVQPIQNLTGMHIDHYVEVNFFQFIDITNAIGGVTVCLTDHAQDSFTGINLGPGTFVLNGEQALQFVRQRHGLPGGDLDRIKRQQRFVTSLVHKAEGIRNPATINSLLEAVTKSITVDNGLDGLNLLHLAYRLKDISAGNVRFATIPVANADAHALLNGQNVDYVQLDMVKLKQFFANIQAERDPNYVPPSATATAKPVPAQDVSVEVLNGSGVTGAASSASTKLAAYGFVTAGTGNGISSSTSTIRYPAGEAGAAVELAKAVPGATTVEDDTLTGTTVVLTIGSSFTGIQDPATVTTPPVTPTPSPTVTTQTAADSDCGP